jgi:hypothetical protein
MSYDTWLAHQHAYIAVLVFYSAYMQVSYPPDNAPQLAPEAVVPAEDWDVLFRAVLERLCAAVASERVDASVRACVYECVESLKLLQHTLPGARASRAP